jgi:hypothetical protein
MMVVEEAYRKERMRQIVAAWETALKPEIMMTNRKRSTPLDWDILLAVASF